MQVHQKVPSQVHVSERSQKKGELCLMDAGFGVPSAIFAKLVEGCIRLVHNGISQPVSVDVGCRGKAMGVQVQGGAKKEKYLHIVAILCSAFYWTLSQVLVHAKK